MLRVHESVEEVRKTIKSNLFDKAGKVGHLVQKKREYLACLEMKNVELEQLLRKDEMHWTKQIQATKKQAKDIQA